MITDKQSIYEALETALRNEGHAAGHAEGFREGYAKAMADMTAFLADRQPPTSKATRLLVMIDDADRQRRPKGKNAELVREVLMLADKPHNPTEIKRMVADQYHLQITYSSTRNALLQLKAEGVAKEVDGLWSVEKGVQDLI